MGVTQLTDPMTFEITLGQPVKGKDFFDREETIMEIWNSLERTSVLLVAPRRFGKTSIMRKLSDNPKNGFKPLFFDVEHIESPQEFILELLEEIQKRGTWKERTATGIKKLLTTAGEHIEEVEAASLRVKLRESKNVNWKMLGKQLLKIVTKYEKKFLIILDEFPEMIKLMIENDKKASTNESKVFLAWMRQLRLTMPEDLQLRFLFAGSISLDSIVGKIHCGPKINDLKRIKVGPFSQKHAQEFIKALFQSENIKIQELVIDAMLEEIGTPIPYFIQVLTSALVRESRDQGCQIDREFVQEVYQQYLLGSDYKNYFDHYHLRLAEYYLDSDNSLEKVNVAKRILTEISIVDISPAQQLYQLYLGGTGTTEDPEGFAELMGLLQDEFYLEYLPGEESYRFYSKLLRDWWYRHFAVVKVRER